MPKWTFKTQPGYVALLLKIIQWFFHSVSLHDTWRAERYLHDLISTSCFSRISPYQLSPPPSSPHAPPPLSISPTKVIQMLQLMNLQWHIINNQSTQLTLRFTLGVVHSMDLDKCIMVYAHHYGSIQNIFTHLKILCGLPIHSFLLPNPWQSLIFLQSP